MAEHTPLYDVHRSLGATLTDFAGWLMPLRYGSETAEHRAVREDAGIFDLSHMGEIFVTGPQAGEALDYAVVGNMSSIKPGRARYTMICAPDGGVLDDLIVYRLEDEGTFGGSGGRPPGERFMVVSNAANYPLVARELTQRARPYDGATVEDLSRTHALIAVQGPRSQSILEKMTETDVASLKYYAAVRGAVAGVQALIARTGYTGEDGFELFVAAENAYALWHAVMESGSPTPAGLSARDTLRLEAGMPLYGNELSAERTPYEANLGRVVKLEKEGDFIGKEALSKRGARKSASRETGPAERLIGLVARGRRVPRHGYPIVDASGTAIGEITSGAPSPTLGKPLAMGYVAGEPPEDIFVDIRGRHEPVDVVELPFYKRSKK